MKTILIAAGGIMLMAGCKKWVEQGNVNINPNRAPFQTLATGLPAVEFTTANNYAQVGYNTTMYSEQMAAYTSGPQNDDQFDEVRMGTAFELLYSALTNARLLIDMAVEKKSPHYTAIARILFVTNLSIATDTWGDIPITEAFQAPVIIQPKYDKQEDLYALMHDYLDKAIVEMDQTNPADLKPGVDDLVFGGDMASWKRTAWFLKARLYMHTTKKDKMAAATNAKNALAKGFTASSKDYQMLFSERNPNPWFNLVSGRISGSATFTIAPSKRFCDALNGTSIPSLVDPRLKRILGKSASAATFTGIPNGFGNTNNSANLTDTTFYAQRSSPMVLGSYAEQKLIEAEALFILDGKDSTTEGSTTDAYAAYREAIRANMDKLAVIPQERDAYLAHDSVNVGAGKMKLEHIMREKMVAMFLNPDMWVDVRRYDHNPNLFRGFVLPVDINPAMNNQFIRRALLPLEELNRNPNAKANLKTMLDKVWWDQ